MKTTKKEAPRSRTNPAPGFWAPTAARKMEAKQKEATRFVREILDCPLGAGPMMHMTEPAKLPFFTPKEIEEAAKEMHILRQKLLVISEGVRMKINVNYTPSDSFGVSINITDDSKLDELRDYGVELVESQIKALKDKFWFVKFEE